MATPSLAMIPSAYADSKVYSVLPNNGDGDFTFNRDSSATRVGQNGLIQEVGYFGSNIVQNGDFSNGSTDWGLGSNWSVADGKASCDGSASNSMSQASTEGIASTTFKVSYDVLSISQGSIRITLGGVAGASVSQTGSYSDFITATSTDRLRIFADSSAIASIDNIIVQQVTGDQPRLNYDINANGVVQSCPSLLLEPASTNLVTYSESMNQYTPVNGTITPNALTSPEGLLNAVKFTENSANNLHYFDSNSISVTSGTKYTISVFAKYNGRFLTIQGSGPLNSAFATFNLQNGTIEQESVGDATIEAMPNNWYRCMFTVQMNNTTNAVMSILLNDSATGGRSRSYQGDGASGVYLFGFQTEQQSYATSYIPTNGASQTRAAETCDDAGTVSTFNSTEGVLYAEIATNNLATFKNISINDGSNSNRINLFIYNAALSVNFDVGGVNQASLSYTIPDVLSFNKLAFSYKINEFKLFVNGTQRGSTDTSGIVPPINTFNELSFNDSFGSPFYGNCKDIRVYNEALTDAQLQTLTT